MDGLSSEERKILIQRARAAIAAAVNRVVPPPASAEPAPVDRRAGAFVTIKVHGELRGCIGYPAADLPLGSVVERCAVSAAVSDPRFSAVLPEEYDTLEVEISVLGPIEPVEDVSEIEIGRHGLIAELGPQRGLLLPQVAVEWGWAREEFLQHTCVKAGLSADAWQQGARLFRFEADVFGDLPHRD